MDSSYYSGPTGESGSQPGKEESEPLTQKTESKYTNQKKEDEEKSKEWDSEIEE